MTLRTPKAANEPVGVVFDIQGYSVHDGPGCRTLVFLKGCPLRCEWCANPEGMELHPVLLFRASRCRRKDYECNRCVTACPYGAITPTGNPEQPLEIDREHCHTCTTLDCTRVCHWDALAACGYGLPLSELMRIVERDRQYWGTGGGVTFTGGEPFFQREFTLAALKRCREAFVHTGVETSAHVETQYFLEAMQYVDWAFIDIKHMDPEQHRKYTRVSNQLILRNIRALAQSNWPGRLVIRTPVIAGFNDTVENMAALADFLREAGLEELNLLPFHRMGDSKWNQLGLLYPYREYEPTPMSTMQELQDLFVQRGIACYVGPYTPF